MGVDGLLLDSGRERLASDRRVPCGSGKSKIWTTNGIFDCTAQAAQGGTRLGRDVMIIGATRQIDERGLSISRTRLALGACPRWGIGIWESLQLEAVSGEGRRGNGGGHCDLQHDGIAESLFTRCGVGVFA